jgi:DNA-binding NtrC family response regulator
MNTNTDLSKKNILIVDDEIGIVELLIEELGILGIKAKGVFDGNSALNALQGESYDLIISDYKMPGLNGIELIRFIGDLKIKTPVILLSGNADQSTFREAWRLGVFDFFQKPFEIEKVIEQVREVLINEPEALVTKSQSFLKTKYFNELKMDIDKETFALLKAHCLERSISISTYINQLLDQSLKK